MHTLREWLEGLGVVEYAEAFERNHLDFDLLRDLSDDDLRELGVVALGHRKLLLRAIATLAHPQGGETAPVLRAAASGEPTAQAAERRQVTVLFCDLVGSTELANRLDPEELRRLMLAYRQACTPIVERYADHIAQYLGDGIMAYFGWPRAHEDDATRAVHAGLEIVCAVMQVQAPAPLRVRVGIATGPVVVGHALGEDTASSELAVGSTPNLAARLQGLAGADEVVIGTSTRQLTGGTFDYRDLGEHALKGIAYPVRAWKVERVSRAEDRFEAAHLTQLPPLVGREHELALLLDRWARAKEGEGQVVALSGEPGIGKSRIAQALFEPIAAKPHYRLRYQCSPYHVNSAFHPIIEHLQRTARLDADDSPEEKLAKLETLLAPVPAQAPRSVALLAALLSIPASGKYPPLNYAPQKQKDETIRALGAQLATLAAQAPAFVLVEDLHWCDPSSLEVFNHLVQLAQRTRVLALVTFRPEFATKWTGQSHVTLLTLNRLGRRQIAEVVSNIAGGKSLPGEVLEQIAAKTDGVPLFVEELTKSVLESGLLAEERGRYRFTTASPLLAIPATLRDSLMARLDRLSPVKELAQIGACIGREFGYQLLSQVASLKGMKLDQALEQLAASELVFQRGSPPDASYLFKHALVQDAAYDSLLKSRRVQLHAQILSALEETYSETNAEHIDELAYHAVRAQQWEKAAQYASSAGKRDVAASAYRESVAWFEQGLAALEHLPDTLERSRRAVDLHVDMRNALEGLGAYDRIPAHLQMAEELALRSSDKQRLAWVLGHQADSLVVSGQEDLARDIAQRALSLAEEVGDVPAQIIASQALGLCFYQRGAYKAGIQAYTRALSSLSGYAHRSDLSKAIPPAVYCGFNLGWPHAELGEFQEALRYGEETLCLAEKLQHPHGQLVAHQGLACVFALRGEFAQVIAHGERELALIEESGIRLWFPWVTQNLGLGYAFCGQAQRAIQLIESGLEALAAMGISLYRSWLLASLTEAHLVLDDLESAGRRASETLDTAEQHKEYGIKVRALRLCGEVASRLGNRNGKAVGCFEAAIELADELGTRPHLAHSHLGLGRHYARVGERAKGKQHVSAAWSMYHEMQMSYWQEQAKAA